MAQLLRGINVLPEVRFPPPTRGVLQPTVTPSPQAGSDRLFGLHMNMHACSTHTPAPIYMCACSNKNNRNTDLEKYLKVHNVAQ